MHSSTKNRSINLVFGGESYHGGMAGSKRIQNLINPLREDPALRIHNLDTSGRPSKKKPAELNLSPVVTCIVHYDLKRPLSVFKYYFKGTKFLRTSKRNATLNVLYWYDTPSLITFPFIAVARLLGYKIYIDIVEDYGALEREMLSIRKKILYWSHSVLLKAAPLYASRIYAISTILVTNLQKKFDQKITVSLLPISVDFSHIGNISGSRNDVLKVFYGGSFGEKDGIEQLLRAFLKIAKQLPHCELILTGVIPAAVISKITTLFAAAPDRIKFLGYLPDDEYYRILNSCDVHCMTRINSKYASTGFPFKLGEMLATGKPVIATTVGDVPTYLTHELNAILVEPGSSEAISDAMSLLLTNRELARSIGEAGRMTALRHFDAVKVSEILRSHLHSQLALCVE